MEVWEEGEEMGKERWVGQGWRDRSDVGFLQVRGKGCRQFPSFRGRKEARSGIVEMVVGEFVCGVFVFVWLIGRGVGLEFEMLVVWCRIE